jgi:hypothetical protein
MGFLPYVLLVTCFVPCAQMLDSRPGLLLLIEAVNCDTAIRVVHARHQLCKRVYRILHIAHIA